MSYIPVRPHHVGQREVSFTTPEANMSLKSNQRSSQNVTRSCSLTPRDPLINVRGATRIQRKPTSRSKLSLDRKSSRGKKCISRKFQVRHRERGKWNQGSDDSLLGSMVLLQRQQLFNCNT